MEIGYGNDTFFFDITSADLLGDNSLSRIIDQDVVSFSITEEMARLTTGAITVNDNLNYYSRVMRNGMRLNIAWGYKHFDAIAGVQNKSWRTGIQTVIQTPSGGGAENGLIDYSVSFYSNSVLNKKAYVLYNTGSRYYVIQSLFDDLGIVDTVIDFVTGSVALSNKISVRQAESSYNLLYRLAKEWNCLFMIGFKEDGTKAGLFIDPWKIKTSGLLFNKKIILTAGPKELYFNAQDKSNVKSYTWQQHIGESGQGDQVDIRIGIDGKAIFERRVAEGQKVITYVLNPGKIEAAYATKTNIADKTALFTQFANAEDFDEVKWAFDKVETVTAPQGQGFTINVEMVGDPLLMPGQEVVFKEGFPSILSQAQSIGSNIVYFILKATHTITKQGYSTSLEIVDSYTLNGSFLQNTREFS
jgi:hypothetical protein